MFNGEEFIDETIKSVLIFQNQFDLEYIVVNDGSTDGTLEKLKKFGDKVTLVDQRNLGESASVNTGIKLAKSEILLVVSADDPLFTPKLFIGVKELFSRNPKLVAAYCDWRKIDEKGALISEILVADFDINLLLGRSQCLPGPGTFFRKSAAQEIGGRNKDWKYVGDYDFWLRLSCKGEILHRRIVAAQWRQHEFSTSIRFRGTQMAEERILVIKNFINGSKNSFSKKLTRMALGNAYYSAARLCYFDPSVKGKYLLLKSFGTRMWWVENAKMHEIIFIILTPISNRGFNLIKGSLKK